MKNIKKRVLSHLAAAAVVAPLAVVGTSGEAFAWGDRNVQWKNAQTGRCLTWNSEGVLTTAPACGRSAGEWSEKEVSNGVFQFREEFQDQGRNRCLDSSDAGRVYLNPCNSGNYQKWRETKTSTGWKLTNVATGLVLDSSDGGKVYTKPDNGGKYQRWL